MVIFGQASAYKQEEWFYVWQSLQSISYAFLTSKKANFGAFCEKLTSILPSLIKFIDPISLLRLLYYVFCVTYSIVIEDHKQWPLNSHCPFPLILPNYMQLLHLLLISSSQIQQVTKVVVVCSPPNGFLKSFVPGACSLPNSAHLSQQMLHISLETNAKNSCQTF